MDAPPPHPPAARWIARHPLDTFSRYTMPQCTLNVGRALRADNVRVPDDLVRDVCQGGNRHNISATLGLQYWTLLKATVSLPGALAVVRVPYITRDTTHLPPWDEFRRRVSPKQVGRTPRKCFLWKYIIADVFPVTHRHSVIRVGVCTIPIVEKISLEICLTIIFSLPPSRDSDPGSHSRLSSPLSPLRFVPCIFIARRFSSFFPRRRASNCTYPR